MSDVYGEEDMNTNNHNHNANTVAMDEETMAAEAAAAQVAVMDGNHNHRRHHQAAEDAILGGGGGEHGDVEAYMDQDESGKLVEARFLQFLESFSQQVSSDNTINEQEEEEEEAAATEPLLIYPYAEQAAQMAQKQLARRSLLPDDNDNNNDTDSNNNNATPWATTLGVDFEHVLQADAELAEALLQEYVRFEPYVQRAVRIFCEQLHPELQQANHGGDNEGSGGSGASSSPPLYSVAWWNLPSTVGALRQLRMDHVGQLVTLTQCTVTRTTEVRPELRIGAFRCQVCGLVAGGVRQEYQYSRPTLCRNPRCKNANPSKFWLETSASQFGDWQKLRVQEASDEIPPGGMPRSLTVLCRNEMVEACKAGDVVTLTGYLVVLPDGSALSRAGEVPQSVKRQEGSSTRNAAAQAGGGVRGLAALGVRELTYRTAFCATTVWPRTVGTPLSMATWLRPPTTTAAGTPSAAAVVWELTASQRQEIRDMKAAPRLYELLVDSLCPSVFGHREIKKGLLLLLLGGVHKTTSDGIGLRGDLNVCVVGDPSTAKSQFLKYVHEFAAPRSVYTSGKASSAAGLTAAVQKDVETGEYGIEAGALMLADNGICCIDEFDKMDPQDQVAIHEAMEQQTISITKAGIQATLNARASILAAANPIHGRYDRTKTLKANVALSAPILSRFDLFFVVLDDCNPEADRRVAQHILNVHRNKVGANQTAEVPFSKEQMQRYIRFARTINPRLTRESQRILVDCYRKLRQGDSLGSSNRSAYRITVRQLESMIRLSEALARLHCDPNIQPDYVREAFRLLKTSIIQVETSDVDVEDDGDEPMEDDDNGDNDQDNKNNQSETQDDEPETQQTTNGDHHLETQPPAHPGEYTGAKRAAPEDSANDAGGKPKKKKTKISYEEYQAIANAVAVHLRSLESEDDEGGGEGEAKPPPQQQYLTWGQVVEWYLGQVEQRLGDSLDELHETRQKINLVIRRLVNVDHVLVTVGDPPRNKKEEQKALLTVHPNYVL